MAQPTSLQARAWDEHVGRFVADRATVTIGEIATTALGISGRLATTDRLRISACLERLAWVRSKKDWRGRIPWLAPTTDRAASKTLEHL